MFTHYVVGLIKLRPYTLFYSKKELLFTNVLSNMDASLSLHHLCLHLVLNFLHHVTQYK